MQQRAPIITKEEVTDGDYTPREWVSYQSKEEILLRLTEEGKTHMQQHGYDDIPYWFIRDYPTRLNSELSWFAIQGIRKPTETDDVFLLSPSSFLFTSDEVYRYFDNVPGENRDGMYVDEILEGWNRTARVYPAKK